MPLQFPAQGEGGGGCCCVLGHFQSIDCVQHSLNTLSQMILACNNITTARENQLVIILNASAVATIRLVLVLFYGSLHCFIELISRTVSLASS